jgi:CBS domain
MQSLSTLTVRDMMVAPAFSLPPETEVTDAMAFLVEKGVSGVPVTTKDGVVVGVVSGYDLLALDCTPGKLDRSYFPPVDTCINEFGGDRKMMWSNFKQLRSKLNSADGKTVQEVRTLQQRHVAMRTF